MSVSARQRRKPKLEVKPGDYVLLGTYAALPGHWWHGKVLHVHGESLFLLRWNQNGQEWTQESSIHHVRAIGNIAELVAIQDTARKAVAELADAVHEAEAALGIARGAVHAKLEELAKGGLAIAPYDRAAEDAHDASVRAAVESYDEQEA